MIPSHLKQTWTAVSLAFMRTTSITAKKTRDSLQQSETQSTPVSVHFHSTLMYKLGPENNSVGPSLNLAIC